MPRNKIPKYDVLILSADFGTGHHQVSLALRKVLEAENPFLKVGIINFFKFIPSLWDRALKFGYFNMIKHFPRSYDWFYGVTRHVKPNSHWQKILNRVGQQKLLSFIEKTSPKIIVCTFPTPAGVISQLKAKGTIHIPLIAVITDVAAHSQWIHPQVDSYLIGADTLLPQMIRIGIPRHKIHVTGIPVRPQFSFPVPKVQRPILSGTKDRPFRLLIMGGGKGLMPGIERICQGLGGLGLPIEITILVGYNKTLENKLRKLASSSSISIRVFGYVEDIASFMRESDLLLSKAGGITVFEALATNLPILIYKPLPGHEMCNVNFLMDKGAALLTWDPYKAIDIIKDIIEDPSILINMKKAIFPLAKPNSTKAASDIIIKLMHKTDLGGNLKDKLPIAKYYS